MKKLSSIFLSLLMLASMVHLTVATHYCGGKIAATEVSLTGKLADCGMERPEGRLPFSETTFSRHCCDDAVFSCSTDNNYIPSVSFVPDLSQHNFQVFALITKGLSVNSVSDIILSYKKVSPPGVLMSTDVDLSDICVFRI